MAKARRSGIVVTPEMVPVILGMVERGDRNHDIGAWFGLNQGRIKETKNGDYGLTTPAPADELPPAGSPGPRALRLRKIVIAAIQSLSNGGATAVPSVLKTLKDAIADFDKDQ